MYKITVFKNFVQILGNRTLAKIINAIQIGVYQDEVLAIRRMVERGDKKGADEIKKQLLAFTVSGCFEGGRTLEKLKAYNPFVILDIDNLKTQEVKTLKPEIEKIKYTRAAFLSPGGRGFKIIIEVDSTQDKHAEAFRQVSELYESKLHIQTDKSGKDITRLCFFSFDETAYYDNQSAIFQVKDPNPPAFNFDKNVSKNKNSSTTKVMDEILKMVEKKQPNKTGSRNNSLYLFACNCNRKGIKQTVTLAFALEKYYLPKSEIINTVDSAYQHNKSEFGKNRTVKKQQKRFRQLEAQEDFYQSLTKTPTFANGIYSKLPDLLRRCCNAFETSREKDVFLTATLTILSGAANTISGTYDGRKEYSNLFSFVVAPPASGKGVLKYAAKLGAGWHQKMLDERGEALSKHKAAQIKHQQAIKDFTKGKRDDVPALPDEPQMKLFYIPANSSSAMVIRHLQESDGVGVICETEADTLGNVLKQDWGGFSDLLRKAFHFESISYSRKSNEEYRVIESPKLSVALSGTPGQVFQLIPSAEDGLYSRFCFYAFSTGAKWRDVSPDNTKNLEKFFDNESEIVLSMFEFWQSHSATFDFKPSQWKDLNQHFENLLHDANIFERWEGMSIIKRMGLIQFRVAMLLTAIRQYEANKWSKILVCSDQDYRVSKAIVEVFRQHSFFLLGMLGKPKGVSYRRLPNLKRKFYEALPEKFERRQAVEIGQSLEISRTSVDRWLGQFSGVYLEVYTRGVYLKKNGQVKK